MSLGSSGCISAQIKFMKTFFVGIDISKSWIDVAVCDDNQNHLDNPIRISNDSKSINEFCNVITSTYPDVKLWFCFEHTGNYGTLLAQVLERCELTYSTIPPLEIKQSIGITRGKNDQIDAKRIAEYASTHAKKLIPTSLPNEKILKIKSYLTYRNQLIKVRLQLKNSRKSHLISHKSYDIKGIIDNIDQKINELNQDIKLVEHTIDQLICSDNKLQENYRKVKTVKGVGPVIAGYMIIYTNNFSSFENPRKFNCFAGLAPFQNSSGSSIRGKNKTSQLRNRTMKRILFNGANTAIIYDQELKAYYKRKIGEGKHHLSVINAVACKLVYRMFAVVKRDEPFVNLVR
jgi:transposase